MQESILLFFKNLSTPMLDKTAELVTMLGEQYFFIIIISFIFWNCSKRNGFKLSATFIFSAIINAVLKIAFHTARPFEKLDFISGKRVHTATGYSFPSGHTQGSTTFFVTMAKIVKRNWFTACAIILLILVGVSRVYLGVHWPVDVLGGIFFGVAVSFVLYRVVDEYYDNLPKLRKIFLNLQLAIIFVTILLYFTDLFFLKGSMKIRDFFKISGVSTGAVFGFFLEERYINFSATKGKIIKKIARFLVGILITAIIMFGLKFLLPENHLLNFFRYTIIGLWVTFLWPALGEKLNLFSKP